MLRSTTRWPTTAYQGGITDEWTAKVLAHWIWKITGAELEIGGDAGQYSNAIYIGQAAVTAGLKLDSINSPSHEGLRVVVKGNKALIAGQSPAATCKAVCRFLEDMGCRYFMDTSYYRGGDKALGEVYPRTRDLSVKNYSLTEKPGLAYRDLWGSSWFWGNLWKVWNGCGGEPMSAGHSWSRYVPGKVYFNAHPEYFALRVNMRVNQDRLCTTNPEVKSLFTGRILAKARSNNGRGSFSISPPDNRIYCECAACRGMDDPTQLVPSSGNVSMSKRFLAFYEDIARAVGRVYPRVLLNFYCYADYTEPPRNAHKLPRNLVAWIAPIRYSRYHHIGNPISKSRMELQRVIDGWTSIASHIAYRTYNFNLAESTVPFAKLSTWKHDIPYLKEKGCLGVNMETFPAWAIMGPHIYQSARLLYEPGTDPEALMNDYYLRLYGPNAAPLMKACWTSIDWAFQNLRSESGCFYALHLVYTAEFLKKLQGLIDTALKATEPKGSLYYQHVALANKGLAMAWDYMAYWDAINKAQFDKAAKTARRMYDRARSDQFAFHNKTVSYISRFLKYAAEVADRFTRPPNRLVEQLPDTWRMKYDPKEEGIAKGFHLPTYDDSRWREVKTYSATLYEQGVPEHFTFMWYRATFNVPKKRGKLLLLFLDIDGSPSTLALYINGKKVKWEPNRRKRGRWYLQRRKPVWAYVTGAVNPGKNTVALMLDHREISELFLGGIVRPVVLCEVNEHSAKQ